MHSIVASSALVPRVASSSTALTVFSSDVTLVTMTWERNKTTANKSNEDVALKDVACGPMQPNDKPFVSPSVVWTLHRTLRVYCTNPQTGGARHPRKQSPQPWKTWGWNLTDGLQDFFSPSLLKLHVRHAVILGKTPWHTELPETAKKNSRLEVIMNSQQWSASVEDSADLSWIWIYPSFLLSRTSTS